MTAMGASASERFPLRRRELAKALLVDPGDLLVVAGLGSTAWDVTAAGDRPLNFPLWGAMGGAAMVGLGLALAQPERRVLVVTGDGELLMGMGSFATIAVQRPPNLAIVVFDNERYGETGMQATHTAEGVDLAGVAAACGFPLTGTVREQREVDAALPGSGPRQVPSSTSPRCAPSRCPSRCRPKTALTLRTASAKRCWRSRGRPDEHGRPLDWGAPRTQVLNR